LTAEQAFRLAKENARVNVAPLILNLERNFSLGDSLLNIAHFQILFPVAEDIVYQASDILKLHILFLFQHSVNNVRQLYMLNQNSTELSNLLLQVVFAVLFAAQ
jgi:hypothetical protein